MSRWDGSGAQLRLSARDAARLSPARSDQLNAQPRNMIMSVAQFHRAADSLGTLFMLLMGLAAGGAMAVVGL